MRIQESWVDVQLHNIAFVWPGATETELIDSRSRDLSVSTVVDLAAPLIRLRPWRYINLLTYLLTLYYLDHYKNELINLLISIGMSDASL